jgi:3-phenylpropionate/trans-cinnamate dioxygenase ferredoxin subunit
VGEQVRLCSLDEIASGEARRFEVAGRAVALVRVGDQFFAVDDVCSHEDFPLSEGEVLVDECEIECARHGSTFDLRTGEPRSFPATRSVPVYEVRTEGSDVVVTLP